MVATNKMEKGRRGVLLELYVAYYKGDDSE